MKIVRWVGKALVALGLAIGLFFVGARFADGPMGMVSGGPFATGEPAAPGEPDWSFVRDTLTVEFQLESPARSRTTWIVEHEGKIYVPSGYMNSRMGKIWKQWPKHAEKNGRAILRVGGKLYERQLVRVKTGPVIEPVVTRLAEKYNLPPRGTEAVNSGGLWLFELAPRG